MPLRYGLALVLAAAFAVSSSAQHNIFLQLPDVEGEATEKDHSGWIELESFSHSYFVSTELSGGRRTRGAPQHSPFSVAKLVDRSSPILAESVQKGTLYANATLHVMRRVADTDQVFFEVELTNVYIVDYALSGSIASINDAFSMVYETISWRYTQFGSDGSQVGTVEGSASWADNTSLAVGMAGLEAVGDGPDVVLRWQTHQEIDNVGFEIQREVAGDFERAAYVPGAGRSDQVLDYEVRIRGLPPGRHVFRVAQIAYNSEVHYSPELEVYVGVPEGVTLAVESVFPNPVRDRATLRVTVAETQDVRVTLHDLLGREVRVLHQGPLDAGFGRLLPVPLGDGLAAGRYVVRVVGDGTVAHQLVTVLP